MAHRFAIRHNGVDLPYRTFDKRQQVNQAAIVENKRLGPVLAYIAAEGARHVTVHQGPTKARPGQSRVRLGRRLRNLGAPRAAQDGIHFNPTTRKGGYPTKK